MRIGLPEGGDPWPALVQAVYDGHLKTTKLLVKHGADVNAVFTYAPITTRPVNNQPGESPSVPPLPSRVQVATHLLSAGMNVTSSLRSSWRLFLFRDTLWVVRSMRHCRVEDTTMGIISSSGSSAGASSGSHHPPPMVDASNGRAKLCNPLSVLPSAPPTSVVRA